VLPLYAQEIDVMRPQVTQLRNAYEAASSMVQKLSEQLKANLQVNIVKYLALCR